MSPLARTSSANDTALITGVSGQDGRLLSRLLLANGLSVVGITRSSEERLPTLPRLQLVQMDLRDGDALAQLVRQVRPVQVFHLAAHHHSTQEAGSHGDLTSRAKMLAINFDVTRHLAFALLSEGIDAHMVLAASSQMYRAVAGDRVIDEDSSADPGTFYGLTKAWSADLLRNLRVSFGLRASVAILFNHESPLRRSEFVTRKISMAAASAALGKPIKLELLNLGARTDWSSAHDIVEGLYLMACRSQPDDYVLASGSLHSVRQLVKTAFSYVSLDWRQFTEFREDREVPAVVGLPKKAELTLGWRRSRRFDDVISEMVQHDLQLLRRVD